MMKAEKNMDANARLGSCGGRKPAVPLLGIGRRERLPTPHEREAKGRQAQLQLEDGTVAVPTLQLSSGGSCSRLVGDLSETAVLRQFLHIVP